VDSLIAWSGFLGAWLLVAGPIYQAVIELEAEACVRVAVAAGSALVEPPPRTSAWWWLLPPVGWILHRRRARTYQQAVMDAMPRKQLEQFVRFSNKATGWLFVALGAFFIAVKETWELTEHNEWPLIIFWLLLVVLLAICTLNTAVRIRRTHQLLGAEEG
jgi:hypothetical protein